MRIYSTFIAAFICVVSYGQDAKIYLHAALKAEQWLQTQEVDKKDSGIVWLSIKDSIQYTTEAYKGSSGTILFYFELYNLTGNNAYLHKAERGLRYMLLKPEAEVHYWTAANIAGMVYCLHQGYLLTAKPEYKRAAIEYLHKINQQIVQVDSLRNYLPATHYQHVGLIFLYADKYKLVEDGLTVAKHIGDIFLQGSLRTSSGIRWGWYSNADTSEKKFLPNFSHGTSGVAYYLAELYKATHEKKYLTATLQAAEYLLSISNDKGYVPLWDPNPSSRYYLGVCHGPAGTTRLYYELSELTGKKKWDNVINLAAGSVINSGIPEKLTSGFWNNVSQCCGSAGIAEWFIGLHKKYNEPLYLEFSKHLLNDILHKATQEGDGIYWIQAENSGQPNLLQAQTGYGQGAAGVGIALLHMYAYLTHRKALIRLPDQPF